MKSISLIFALFSLLAISSAITEDLSVDQIKEKMMKSGENLSSYAYHRLAESSIIYRNESLQEKFEADKTTEGKVNLTAKSGWWSHRLTDRGSGETLVWQGFFVNGDETWKEGENWTDLNITDPDEVLDDYNELPGQIQLLNFCNLSVAGQEEIGGEECYRLAGEPEDIIKKVILGYQLYAAYLSSPLSLPDELERDDFDFGNTTILENSNVSVAAWIGKDSLLPRRIEINSSLVLNPSILNIDEDSFTIESSLLERTDFGNFGQPVQIVLPEESQNQTTRSKGADWRWAIFGLLVP